MKKRAAKKRTKREFCKRTIPQLVATMLLKRAQVQDLEFRRGELEADVKTLLRVKAELRLDPGSPDSLISATYAVDRALYINAREYAYMRHLVSREIADKVVKAMDADMRTHTAGRA